MFHRNVSLLARICSAWIFIAILVFGIAKFWTVSAVASCEAAISPYQFTPESSNAVTITVTNTSAETLEYISIGRPSTSYTIVGHAISGWDVSASSSEIIATNGAFDPDAIVEFNFTVTAGAAADQDDWVVYGATTPEGTNPAFCSGNISSAIGEASDITAPTISLVSASGISNTAATVTWTTNELSTSVVSYGIDESYGDTVSSDTLTTLHSLALSGLTANTEYHIKVTSVDSSGNSASSGDEVFITSNTAATTTPTRTPTPTTASTATATATPTVTPTPVPDKEKPIVSVTAPNQSISKTVPVFSGTVIDNGEVSSLEYTTDEGKQWRVLKGWKRVSTTKLISYTFTPIGVMYGGNRIQVRAKDTSGNIGVSSIVPFVFDDRGPNVYEHTSLDSPFSSSPTIQGSVDDISGESSIAYSIDDGRSWLPADVIRLLSPQKTGFGLEVPPLPDGNYPMRVKAIDRFGSQSEERIGELIIDRIPPKIGAGIYAIGSLLVRPNAQNRIQVLEKNPITMFLSVIGGATSVSASVITESDDTETHRFSLSYNRATNVWTGRSSFPKNGRYKIVVTAVDGAQKTDEMTIAYVDVQAAGTVRSSDGISSDISLRIFERDTDTNQFHAWDGQAYGFENPQRISADGLYALALPKGAYYIEFSGSGIQTTVTDIFTLSKFTYITDQFLLSPRKKISLPFFSVHVPQFPWAYEKIQSPRSIVENDIGDQNLPPILWKDIYMFAHQYADAVADVPTVVLVVPTWHPDILHIVRTVLTEPRFVGMQKILLAPQESKSTVELFRIRGGFNLTLVPDPESRVLPIVQMHNVPIVLVSSKENGRIVMRSERLFW